MLFYRMIPFCPLTLINSCILFLSILNSHIENSEFILVQLQWCFLNYFGQLKEEYTLSILVFQNGSWINFNCSTGKKQQKLCWKYLCLCRWSITLVICMWIRQVGSSKMACYRRRWVIQFTNTFLLCICLRILVHFFSERIFVGSAMNFSMDMCSRTKQSEWKEMWVKNKLDTSW